MFTRYLQECLFDNYMKFILYLSEYLFHICMNVFFREGVLKIAASPFDILSPKNRPELSESCTAVVNVPIHKYYKTVFGEKPVLATLDVELNMSPTMTTIFQGKHSIAIYYKKRSKLNTAFLTPTPSPRCPSEKEKSKFSTITLCSARKW